MSRLRFGTLSREPGIWVAGAAFALAISVVGCDRSEKSASPSFELESVAVPAGSVTIGFKAGALRKEVQTDAFRIARLPVTRAEYAACADADVCPPVACAQGEGVEPDDAAAQPVDCVGREEAQRFCGWVSARLPTLSEWLKAARGERPQRFAWGDGAPSCEQHPWAGTSRAARSGVREAMFGKGQPTCSLAPANLVVGAHPAGASAAAVEDVLLTQGELVEGVAESPYGACSDGTASGCVVYGLEAGAIDAVTDLVDGDRAAQGVGFRCAWGK
jgi:hypothetical protein